ncbi:glycosyltransferase [bacterium]|nr:glycosyltransferase [bacterium]
MTRASIPTKFLIFWMGTTGDAFPFMGIASALAQRGNNVTVFGNGHFHSLGDRLGLPFVDLISPAKYQERLAERVHALGLESLTLNAKYVLEDLRPVHQAILDHHVPGRTVVVSQSYLLGAKIAQEELGFPLVTTHLYPMLVRSAYGGPWWLPRWLIRQVHRLEDFLSDKVLADSVNALRRERGLPPISRILHEWCHSRDLVLACFPEWLSPRQPDWPIAAHQVGFPEFNAEQTISLSEKAKHFLDTGPAPIVFAHSVAVRLLDGFVEESIAAARALGYRALFLGVPNPQESSNSVLFSSAEPHAVLLPRSAAIVHHGGLGTAMAALRAGIPQLFIPQMLDQPANAKALERIGVGQSISWKSYRRRPLTTRLRFLLNRHSVKSACATFQKLESESFDACKEAALEIESLADRRCHPS